MVPEESVLQRALGPIVFIVDEADRVHQRDVETGKHRRGAVEIKAGIEPGDWVVTSGQGRLLDDLVVRTERREDPFRPAHLALAIEPEAATP
jgi:membrane fusion protein (multidrug efflux system)